MQHIVFTPPKASRQQALDEFCEQFDEVDKSIDQAERDNGVARAYIYDPYTLLCHLRETRCYAMVCTMEDAEPERQDIDLFVPEIMIDKAAEKQLSADRFECIGIIKNHYTDVIGLRDAKENTIEGQYFENFLVACYSIKRPLRAERVEMAVTKWRSPDPRLQRTLAELKRPVVEILQDQRTRLEQSFENYRPE